MLHFTCILLLAELDLFIHHCCVVLRLCPMLPHTHTPFFCAWFVHPSLLHSYPWLLHRLVFAPCLMQLLHSEHNLRMFTATLPLPNVVHAYLPIILLSGNFSRSLLPSVDFLFVVGSCVFCAPFPFTEAGTRSLELHDSLGLLPFVFCLSCSFGQDGLVIPFLARYLLLVVTSP